MRYLMEHHCGWLLHPTPESDSVKEAENKSHFSSPESMITRPETSQPTLFDLNVTDHAMHELDSLGIYAPKAILSL